MDVFCSAEAGLHTDDAVTDDELRRSTLYASRRPRIEYSGRSRTASGSKLVVDSPLSVIVTMAAGQISGERDCFATVRENQRLELGRGSAQAK